ncbi:MAG: hypothetical protein KTR31_00705 [Myxococcales bacterium]|nr:hypothetical protein [Myxococcales bacterium]
MIVQALLLIGCTGTEAVDATSAEPSSDKGPSLTQFGWISEVVLDPPAFAALTEGDARAGWVAMHAHDYPAAVQAFSDDPAARARGELALGLLYADLNRVSGLAYESLFSEWDERGTLPKGNEPPLVAGLASYCSDGSTTVTWAQRITEGTGLPLAQALMQNRTPFEVASSDAFGRRLAIHRAARSSADVQPLLDVAGAPVTTREVKDEEFSRTFWDPCLYRTLSDHWVDRVVHGLRGSSWKEIVAWAKRDTGLTGRIFAAWPTSEDLTSEVASSDHPGLVGARSPLLRKLGVGTNAVSSDDAEQARGMVRVLDTGLANWRDQLLELSDEDGRALLNDLRLIHRFRQEWLVTRARLALESNRPRQALAYLELGRDASEGIGPANGPSLMALMAEVQLRLGHTREALDALQELTEVYPEIVGLKEVVGDLAVLRGLDRQGDSKENQ